MSHTFHIKLDRFTASVFIDGKEEQDVLGVRVFIDEHHDTRVVLEYMATEGVTIEGEMLEPLVAKRLVESAEHYQRSALAVDGDAA